jgi:hypothetical protein
MRDRRNGLPLILACHGQLHVTLVQAVLRFPCNLGDSIAQTLGRGFRLGSPFLMGDFLGDLAKSVRCKCPCI